MSHESPHTPPEPATQAQAQPGPHPPAVADGGGESSPAMQPVWAKAAQPVQWQQTPPLEFHQLYRGAKRYRWWKPLLTLVLALAYYLTFAVLITLPLTFAYVAIEGGDFSLDTISALAVPDTQNPWSILVALLSIVPMIPAVWLAMLSTGLGPIGRGWSVALRLRWSWIWRTVVPAVVSLLVMNTVGVLLEVLLSPVGVSAATEVPTLDIDYSLALVSMAIVLVLVPFQATAEELVFRGLMVQSLGAWFGAVKGQSSIAKFFRGPFIPVAVPAIIFGFAHIYNVWGFLAVVAMGLATGWLAWRTGGLEAAISMHVINNLVAFGFLSLAVGGDTGQTEDAGGFGSLIGQILGLALYCWWVNRLFMKRDGRRTRIDWVQVKP